MSSGPPKPTLDRNIHRIGPCSRQGAHRPHSAPRARHRAQGRHTRGRCASLWRPCSPCVLSRSSHGVVVRPGSSHSPPMPPPAASAPLGPLASRALARRPPGSARYYVVDLGRGGGPAMETLTNQIYILRLIFITAMRGPGGLSRPTNPTSIWPCKHGEISVPLAAASSLPRAARAHASSLLSPLRHRRPAPSLPPCRPPISHTRCPPPLP